MVLLELLTPVAEALDDGHRGDAGDREQDEAQRGQLGDGEGRLDAGEVAHEADRLVGSGEEERGQRDHDVDRPAVPAGADHPGRVVGQQIEDERGDPQRGVLDDADRVRPQRGEEREQRHRDRRTRKGHRERGDGRQQRAAELDPGERCDLHRQRTRRDVRDHGVLDEGLLGQTAVRGDQLLLHHRDQRTAAAEADEADLQHRRNLPVRPVPVRRADGRGLAHLALRRISAGSSRRDPTATRGTRR